MESDIITGGLFLALGLFLTITGFKLFGKNNIEVKKEFYGTKCRRTNRYKIRGAFRIVIGILAILLSVWLLLPYFI